jgi:signal transduction histidine kinase
MQALAALGMLLLQAALISWLLFEQRRRHRAEVIARNTMEELRQVNRMATAGELSASIAHEVNQPLAGIVANANAGMRWLAAATPDLARAAFKQIVAAGHHASDVIPSVRALFKRDIEKRAPLDINQVIRNVVSLERLEFEKHDVSLRLELSERLPQVTGDRVQLLQVILNLVRNAMEATQGSSTRVLYVTSRVDESGGVLVSIEDSGIGIDEHAMKRIFDPLFTTKSGGLGIGLSICRSIIESHHGRLWATSTVGQGSVFYFTLPRYGPGDGWHKPEGTS